MLAVAVEECGPRSPNNSPPVGDACMAGVRTNPVVSPPLVIRLRRRTVVQWLLAFIPFWTGARPGNVVSIPSRVPVSFLRLWYSICCLLPLTSLPRKTTGRSCDRTGFQLSLLQSLASASRTRFCFALWPLQTRTEGY